MTLINRGTPVVSSRLWTYALAPRQAGGWNFILLSLLGQNPGEWVVLENFTQQPVQHIYETLANVYANSNVHYPQQLRAKNGRIFFPMINNYICYYDPDTQDVHMLGPIVEADPIDPHASELLYSRIFDVDGMLYFGTQESHHRPAMIVRLDPVTLDVTVLGYVGTNANSYTPYAYYLAPDTQTPQKWIYVAYGQDPWQGWALNIVTGQSVKLKEVPSSGWMEFTARAQGWTLDTHTNRGQPDDVFTIEWCIDGVLYPWTAGQKTFPFTPRKVQPYANPLVSPPDIDTSAGVGLLKWRDGGSAGPWTSVNYTVNHSTPVPIDKMVGIADGVLIDAQSYQGFCRYNDDGSSGHWFGPYPNFSQGPRLRVDGLTYMAGYPNGVLLAYDDTLPWSATNPINLGTFNPDSDMKYAEHFAWSPQGGRLYCAGHRERSGTGTGLGAWDRSTKTFRGSYAGLDLVWPTGLVVLDAIDTVAVGTTPIPGISNPTGQIWLFDRDCYGVGGAVIAGVASAGYLYLTADPHVVCGVTINASNQLVLYHCDVTTGQVTSEVILSTLTGKLLAQANLPDGRHWVCQGTQLLAIDVDALTATVVASLSAAGAVTSLACSGDGLNLFVSGGVGGAELFTMPVT